ncbi:proto-oncogene c-Rel-like [Gigantopelta aegis]|uniref:proto-oncogene c-Rel-like n=1 Tax=Gigantopelta aegis TaxID=1735272 RepID=UPI001B887DDD|nr:proto-oncogene c-Rel-like [Gigantopelta aegis]
MMSGTTSIILYTNEISHSPSTNGDMNLHPANNCEQDKHIKIINQLHYQRFRYDIEKRTGKKRRDNPLLELELTNIPASSVMKIFCIDAHTDGIAHPNALIGKNCENGIYTHEEFKSEIPSKRIRIPYLQIRRVKSKLLTTELNERLKYLPSPFNGAVDSHHKYDTKMVRLCICLTVPERLNTINHLSSIIKSERDGAKVKIEYLSHVTASVRGKVDPIVIMTREDSPDIEPDDYEVYLEELGLDGRCLWHSPPFCPKKPDIFYKHVIKFPVPAYKDCYSERDIEVRLILKCKSTQETDEVDFTYTADADLGLINRKRRLVAETQAWLGRILNNMADAEPPQKFPRLSPVTGKDVKEKLKGKLFRNGTSESGGNGAIALSEDSASQNINPAPSLSDYLATEPSFQTSDVPETKGFCQKLKIEAQDDGNAYQHPISLHDNIKTDRVDEVEATSLRPEFPCDNTNAHTLPTTVPEMIQGCPNTFFARLNKTCPVTSAAVHSSCTSEPSVGAPDCQCATDAGHTDQTIAQPSTSAAPNSTVPNSTGSPISGEGSIEKPISLLSSDELFTDSLPSMEFSNLTSMDLTTCSLSLTNFINNPQTDADHLEENLK